MQRFIFLAYLFICVNSFSQQYPFVHYTPKDGLVNSRVKKVFQDSKGRMYFLTFGGLSVYDGARFRNYTVQNGLPNNVVNDILEIGDDSFLVATNCNQLNLLVKGKLEPVKLDNSNCPTINQFYRHDDKRIYLSSDNGLFLLQKNKIYPLNISRITENQTIPPFLGGITGVGNFLIVTTNEMRFHKGIYIYDIKMDRICDASGIEAYLLGKDEKNRIWISTVEQLLIVDQSLLQKGKLLLIAPGDGYQQVKDYSTVNVAFSKGAIWVAYRNEEFRNTEIRRISETGRLFSMPMPEQATISYLKNIFIDRENTIWLSNEGDGVFKIINSPLQIFENPLGKSMGSQAGNAFYSNGVTWYNTATNKMYRKSAGSFEGFPCNLNYSPLVFHADENQVLAFDAQNIYEGHIQEHKRIDFQKIITLPDSDFFIRRIVKDNNGAIISGQQSGVNVWLNKKMIYHLPIDKNDVAEELFIDRNGRLWIVRRSNGIKVFQLHPENPLQYLQPLFEFRKEQILGSTRSFLIDKHAIIWIGTRDDGLVAYEQKNDSLKQIYHFSSTNGLNDNFVTSLACDSSNNIIVGTQTGLDRLVFDPSLAYRVENLSKSSNFFGFINMAWADASQAYALTNSGVLLQLSSTAEARRSFAPQLLLEEMRVNAQTIKEKTSFNHKENNISFLVAAPSFIDEKQVTYSYLLEGSGNKQWSDTATSNSVINLTNLSAGKYGLKVKAFFHSTSYPPTELSYSFEITPAWWQSWWFKTIVGLLIIFILIVGFRFYYNRRLVKQKVFLEKMQAVEKERTRIATDMHDDLGAGLSRIKFLSETIGIKKQKQESFEEDISKIREYSHEMIDKMGEIVWALNEKNDSLNDLLSYSRSYAMEYFSQNGIKCNVESPDNIPSIFVNGEFRRNVYLTLKEAFHNIVKHAQANHTNITIRVNHNLVITIQDDGVGFNRNKIRSYSNGLSNMEKRMKEIGGLFEVIPGNGTFIKLTVPLPS
jgi:Signal transduction histidine kinase